MPCVCLYILSLVLTIVFVHLFYLKHVSINLQFCQQQQRKSLKLRKPIGNDIHFHEESHIVAQPELSQSQTTGVAVEVLSSLLNRSPCGEECLSSYLTPIVQAQINHTVYELRENTFVLLVFFFFFFFYQSLLRLKPVRVCAHLYHILFVAWDSLQPSDLTNNVYDSRRNQRYCVLISFF